MTARSEPPPETGLGRLILAVVAFSLLAPLGLIVLPLAALLVLGRHFTRRELVGIAVACIFSFGWLIQVGGQPEQAAKVAALFAALTFAAITVRRPMSTVHSALWSVAAAFVGTAAIFVSMRLSWSAVRWLVEHRIGFLTRQMIGTMWSTAGSGDAADNAVLERTEELFSGIARFIGDHYAGILALQIMLGLVIAGALYRRVAVDPKGAAPTGFRRFAFSDHIGWLAVASLAVVLIPRLVALKLLATNTLVVLATLYAVRGIAVFTVLFASTGAGLITGLMVALAIVFMLPLVVGGAIILGVLDTRLDFRSRWGTSPSRG